MNSGSTNVTTLINSYRCISSFHHISSSSFDEPIGSKLKDPKGEGEGEGEEGALS